MAVTLAHVVALDAWVRWQDNRSVLADMGVPLFNHTVSIDPSVNSQPPSGETTPVETPPVPTVGRAVQARQVWATPAAPKGRSDTITAQKSPPPRVKPPPRNDAPPPLQPPAPDHAPPAALDAGQGATAQTLTPTGQPSDTAAAAPTPLPQPTQPEQPPASLATGASNEPDSTPRWLETWPRSTRLHYKLQGYFRGDFQGTANVQWQRTEARYQAQVNINVTLLLNMSLTSQGRILPTQLWPEVYEEDRRGKKRGVRFGDQWVALNNGDHVPRPLGLQDTASQFVQLARDFSTGRHPLALGAVVPVTLGRPGGVDEWRYEVVARETIQTPQGPLPTYHLRPQPQANPRGAVSTEIWVAPALQHMPVRIRLTLNPETWVDLTLEQVQQAGLD